jgi:hypothetical protein
MRLPSTYNSLFLRRLRFRPIARVSSVSSELDLQGFSIAAKVRLLMERIDDVTDGKVAELDARVICYTIC